MQELDWLIEELIHAKGVVGGIGRGHAIAEGVKAIDDIVRKVERHKKQAGAPSKDIGEDI